MGTRLILRPDHEHKDKKKTLVYQFAIYVSDACLSLSFASDALNFHYCQDFKTYIEVTNLICHYYFVCKSSHKIFRFNQILFFSKVSFSV